MTDDRAVDGYCPMGTIAILLRSREGEVRAVAFIDEADSHLAQHRRYLSSEGYAARSASHGEGSRQVIYLHREVLGLEIGDTRQGDHINGNRLDCRRVNLRIVTSPQNNHNLPARRNSTSRYRGVGFHKATGTWKARVTLNGREHHLGYFHNEVDAAEAVSAARSILMTHTNESRGYLETA